MLDKKDWKWVKTISKDGQVIEPISQDAFVISLDYESNKFTAKTDCNRFFGAFSVNGKNLAFTNIGSTRMFCKASQERIFIDQLASSNSYVLDSLPETIILISKNGGKLFLKSL
jgi:heat shock protein HslJ